MIRNGLDTPRTIKRFLRAQSVEHCDDLELFVYRLLDRVRMGIRMRGLFDRAIARTS